MKFTMMHFSFSQGFFNPICIAFFYTHGSNIESSKLNNLENKILFPHFLSQMFFMNLGIAEKTLIQRSSTA